VGGCAAPCSVADENRDFAVGKGLTAQNQGRDTLLSVPIPFQTAALDPLMVSDTAEQYKKDCEDRADKFLGTIRRAAEAAGVQCSIALAESEDRRSESKCVCT
jgi:hypothetical protein